MRIREYRLLAVFALANAGCEPQVCVDSTSPNLLFIVADDLGLDRMGLYGLAPDAPPTPNIDSLAATGVRFQDVWSSPTCSPTRANMLTGRYGIHTAIGRNVPSTRQRYVLSLEENTLPEALCGYESSAVGKWHLASPDGEGGLDHPNLQGFGWYSGSWANVDHEVTPEGLGQDLGYRNWEKVTNGQVEWTDAYATTDTTDDAIARVHAMEEVDAPWLLWTAYNAPHWPAHVPPDHLFDPATLGDSTDARLYDASVQAMDTEIGRLLSEVDLDNTVVFFVADNGTPSKAVEAPFDVTRAKGTLFEGGIRVPLIVSGPGIETGVSNALVHTTDLFPTALELAGLSIPDNVDGASLLPQLLDPRTKGARKMLFSEAFSPNDLNRDPNREEFAIRNRNYKLIRDINGDQLYALSADTLDDGSDLLAEESRPREADVAHHALGDALDLLLNTSNPGGCSTVPSTPLWLGLLPLGLLAMRRRCLP